MNAAGFSEPFHQSVDGVAGGLVDLLCEMRVDLSGSQTAVPEVDLDDATIGAVFEEVGGVGMSERVDVGSFDDAAELEGAAEGALEAAVRDGTGAGRDEVADAASDGSWKEPLLGAVGAPGV